MNHYYPELYTWSIHHYTYLCISGSFDHFIGPKSINKDILLYATNPKTPIIPHKNPSHLRIFIDPFTKSCFVSSIFWWFIFVVNPGPKWTKKRTWVNREPPTKLVKACAKAAKAAPPMRACSLNSADASPGQTLKVEKTLPTNFCRSQKKNNGNWHKACGKYKLLQKGFQGRQLYCNHIIKKTDSFSTVLFSLGPIPFTHPDFLSGSPKTSPFDEILS